MWGLQLGVVTVKLGVVTEKLGVVTGKLGVVTEIGGRRTVSKQELQARKTGPVLIYGTERR
jgi:hypothetical protein